MNVAEEPTARNSNYSGRINFFAIFQPCPPTLLFFVFSFFFLFSFSLFFSNLLFFIFMPVVSSRMNVISAGSRPTQCLPLFYILPASFFPFAFPLFRAFSPPFFFSFLLSFVWPSLFLSFLFFFCPSMKLWLFCNAASRGKWNLDPDEKTRRRCLIVDVVPRRFSSFLCAFFWKKGEEGRKNSRDTFFLFWTRSARCASNFSRNFLDVCPIRPVSQLAVLSDKIQQQILSYYLENRTCR